MERTAWTDERLDDRAQRVDHDIRELRGDIRELRSDMNAGFAGLRGEIDALRLLTLRLGGGIMASVVAASFLHGI
jgi:hypothetical protein